MGAKKRTKKKTKKIRFELTVSAAAGIVAIFLCLVLWIFLLGVWTGQTLLVPTSKERQSIEASIAHIKQNIAELDDHAKAGH
jgi:hypothetical protein